MKRIRLIQDECAENPRNFCNASKLYCWHSRYNLGDEHSYDCDDFLKELACEYDADLEEYIDYLENDVTDKLYDRAADHGCEGWEDRMAYAEKFVRPRINARIEKALSDGYVIAPIYMYDHSGIALSTSGFSCPWDSGQVGYAVVDKATLDKEFGGDINKAASCICAEVEVYSQYVNGDCYGYENVDDESDSCWGFYGSDPNTNGMKDEIGEDFEIVEDCNGCYS